ncbi:Sir2 family NAD-dependent protein deacetylase [Brevibacillus laterosporus]|uniref:Sir2 family NAD-dependent protein deacetylase n=1 Tax=Brevibacillus laterosporus TaxID=1465 RepID=UPI001C3ED7C9|nr:Sir2 family NAD-dependent protein deacetylase [Brevibacillus laterosporus]
MLKKLECSKYPIAFTGNGLSSLSGVPSFDIKFSGVPIYEILSLEFYTHKRENFFQAFLEFFEWTKLSPNTIHLALSKLNIPVITENIDGLHTKAKNSNIIELHGNLLYFRCSKCEYIETTNRILNTYLENGKDEIWDLRCPSCGLNMRPKLVLKGENINLFHVALNEIYKADLLLVLGNKLEAWPANKLVTKAKSQGCNILQITELNENLFDFNEFS